MEASELLAETAMVAEMAQLVPHWMLGWQTAEESLVVVAVVGLATWLAVTEKAAPIVLRLAKPGVLRRETQFVVPVVARQVDRPGIWPAEEYAAYVGSIGGSTVRRRWPAKPGSLRLCCQGLLALGL